MPLPFCLPFRCISWVEVLDKSQRNLKEVPPAVDRRSDTLLEINLDGNQITELNSGILNCCALRKLSLNQNKLQRIPRAIKRLTMLRELHLMDNELSDLPMEMECCCNLCVLDLRLNVFSRFPAVLTQMASLTHLSLYDTALASLPNDFHKLTNLRFLDLRENHLRIIPPAVGQLKNLKHLDVGKNELVELPVAVGFLEKIEELYADNNFLSELPCEVVQCQQLQTLDVSENEIRELPAEFGDLRNLVELTISNNKITELPNSFGKLKNLRTLSACSNELTELKAAIGDCAELAELRLAKNKLKKLPSAIKDLENLEILSLDENQLIELPPEIGNCRNLKLLTLRGNELRELPFEIGRLENIRVIDVADNKISYLPYSISVPKKLRALWLSIDQRTPLLPLIIGQDPVTNVKVLTCYLLPQGKCHGEIGRRTKTSYGVSFNDNAKDDVPLGQFQRKGTPHPKPRIRNTTPRRNTIDGHYIHHGENKNDAEVAEVQKSGNDVVSEVMSQRNNQGFKESQLKQKGERKVNEPDTKPILRGIINVKKDSASYGKHKFFSVSRDSGTDFGIAIAGGRESVSYKDGDSGIFISKVIVGSPAERAGLLPGDKLIFFNGVDVRNEYQKAVVDMIQKVPVLELVIFRGNSIRKKKTPPVSHETEFLDEIRAPSAYTHPVVEVVSENVPRETDGSYSFTLCTRESTLEKGVEEIIIASLTPGGAAELSGKIAVGDRVLSINGTSISHYTLQEAVSLLYDDVSKCAFLVLRKNSFGIKDIQHEVSVSAVSKDIMGTNERRMEDRNCPEGGNVEAFLEKMEIAIQNLMDSTHDERNEYVDFAQMKAVEEKKKRQRPPVPPKPTKMTTHSATETNTDENCGGTAVAEKWESE